jgi:hypothetical protein
VFQLLPALKERIISLIEAGDVNSREFRYCLKRIELLARYRDLVVPRSYYAEITAAIGRAVERYPFCTDQYVRYLTAVQTSEEELAPVVSLLLDSRRNFYTWQAYRLWLLLSEKRLAAESLMEAARATLKGPDDANRAGATIYLGAMGSQADRAEIATHFTTLESFLGQRSGLVAIHELPFKPHIEQIAKHIRGDLIGVYRSLQRKTRKGRYIAPRQEPWLEFGNEETSYD